MNKENTGIRKSKCRDNTLKYVKDMLHLSRLKTNYQELEPEEFDIEELFKLVTKDKQLLSDMLNQDDLETLSGSTNVYLNRIEIYKILNNLIINVLKYN